MKFRFIDAEKAFFPVSVLCEALGVSRSGYYARLSRPVSARKQEDERLKILLHVAHRGGRGVYGRPRLHAALMNAGEQISSKRVRRLMLEEGLRGKTRRRYVVTTNSDHPHQVFENKLKRDFTATDANERWLGDTTYLRTPTGFIYLAVLLDLYSRSIVGWAVSAFNDTNLVATALKDALAKRRPPRGLMHHSDRGAQYASHEYQNVLAEREMVSSMSRPGSCLDNAAMESWFATLKTELGEEFASIDDAKARLFDYIEVFYNRSRLHSANGYLSPAEFERRARAA